MKVGLTYDLRSDYLKEGYSPEETAEFDKEETIEGIEHALSENGYETCRIGNARHLMNALMKGEQWDLVFNICEGMYGDSRESLVPALLDAYRIPYVFSGGVTLGISLNKSYCKRIVRDAGILTPEFAVVENVTDTEKVRLSYPLFVKPVAEGTGKGIEGKSIVKNSQELVAVCTDLLQKYHQPLLVEEFLPGREFTIGIIGNDEHARAIGGMEIIYSERAGNIYSYFNKENYKELIQYIPVKGKLLKECTEVSLEVWNVLSAYDGGRVDLRMDKEGRINFLEINPLAGLNPVHSDLPIIARLNGISYTRLIGEIMQAAINRIKKKDG
jgi:D-alanine-D-alanine ligase